MRLTFDHWEKGPVTREVEPYGTRPNLYRNVASNLLYMVGFTGTVYTLGYSTRPGDGWATPLDIGNNAHLEA